MLEVTEYNPTDKLICGPVREQIINIKAGEGALLRGQVMAQNTATGLWVKYVSGGSNGEGVARGVLSEDVDATLAVQGSIINEADALGSQGLVGIDYINEDIDAGVTPVLALQIGGSLAATTQHDYKVQGVDGAGGLGEIGTEVSETTTADVAGYMAGLTVADIAAVNTVLGNCTVTAKVVAFLVDGVLHTKSFALDYSGAGALADHAALITALDGTGYTVTSSDGAAITITSDTTGSTSTVLKSSDTTGLFTTPTEVSGTDESETIKVTAALTGGAVVNKVWRSVDGGSTWAYRNMTEAEILNGFFVDDGTLTWTTGTPVTATDFVAVADLSDRKIYIKEVDEGYNFRGGY